MWAVLLLSGWRNRNLPPAEEGGVDRVGTTSEEHDARQRQQDGRIPGLLRRWLVFRRRARVVRWSSAGELIHQPAELTARLVELAVDQGDAFGDEPHVCNGRLCRARDELDGWRSQSIT